MLEEDVVLEDEVVLEEEENEALLPKGIGKGLLCDDVAEEEDDELTSDTQSDEHPSPLVTLLSSHCSAPSSKPLPHVPVLRGKRYAPPSSFTIKT